jgi:hypothetical protein
MEKRLLYFSEHIKKIINNVTKNDKKFALLFAAILSLLSFIVFLENTSILNIDSSDMLRLEYAKFVHIGHLIKSGTFYGVNIFSDIGASELLPKLNQLYYIPLMLFSMAAASIKSVSVQELIYVLFFVMHLFAGLYFAQLVAIDYFNINRRVSILLACSCLTCFFVSTWFLTFFLVSTLVFPLLYCSLRVVKGDINRYLWILMPVPFICGFLSGYITVSVFLVITCFVFSVIYCFIKIEKKDRSKSIMRLICVYFVATASVFLVLLSTAIFLSNNGGPHMRSLPIVFGLEYNLLNFPQIFFPINIIKPVNYIENQEVFFIGILWLLVLVLFFKYKGWGNLQKSDKTLFLVGVVPAVLIFFVQCGRILPFGVWFYSIVPFLGQARLVTRYEYVLMPIFFLSLCILLNKMPKETQDNKVLKILPSLLILAAVLTIFMERIVPIKFIDSSKMFIYLIFNAIAIKVCIRNGWVAKSSIYIWCLILAIFPISHFYNARGIYDDINIRRSKSIVFQKHAAQILDSFAESLGKKDLYKYGYFKSDETVPEYIPGLLGWYHQNKDDFSNYYGYPLHDFRNADYAVKMPWFDIFPIDYMVNSRADFFISDDIFLQKNPSLVEILNGESFPIGANLIIDSFKKYIPMRYTEGALIEDRPSVLDNGIFYAKELNKENLLEFKSNKATWYKARIVADHETEISFLLYPNCKYHYYIDGKEIVAEKMNMCSYFMIPAGDHIIEVVYKNLANMLAVIIILGYYGLIFIYGCTMGVIIGLKKIRRY